VKLPADNFHFNFFDRGKNTVDINIRLETSFDWYEVESLTRKAFWNFFDKEKQTICDEHLLVYRLRQTSAFVPELNFIAEIAQTGQIIGHIIYSKSRVISAGGIDNEVLTFGPISVLPEYQKQGIGGALLRHSLDIAKEMGYCAVLIFGHVEYYPRFGFKPAAEFDIITSEGKSFDSFMVLPLYEGALDGISGRFYLDPVYENLTQEDALEFDKKFI